MEINIPDENKVEITDLYMKVGYVQNEIKKIEESRKTAIQAEDAQHNTNMQTINSTYDTQIADANSTLEGLVTRLSELGIKA